MYTSRRSPKLCISEVGNYEPKNLSDSWEQSVKRVRIHPDDGHASQPIVALVHGEQLSKTIDERDPVFEIRGSMWLQLGHMGEFPICFL